MPNLAGEKLLYVLDDYDARLQSRRHIDDHLYQQVSLVLGAGIRVAGKTPVVLCAAHALTRWAGGKKRRSLGAGAAAILPHDRTPSLSKVTRNTLRPRMISKADLQASLIEFGHHIEAESGSPVTHVPSTAVREEADGSPYTA